MNLKPWKISPDLIPQRDFHKGYWLGTTGPNPWYYFFRTERPYTIPSDSKFYETLDSDLVEVVKLLHSQNIPTTPSCAGHFYSSEHYSEVYRGLELNSRKISTEGIVLENSETGSKYFYRNSNYSLPWDHNSFIDRSLNYQKVGVLGFVDPKKELLNVIDSQFQTGREGIITLVFEMSNNKRDKSLKWNSLCETLTRYLLA